MGSTFEWLTGLRPFEPSAASAPESIRNRLVDMHTALGGDSQKLRNKLGRRLRVDFDLGNRLIIEVDETQHFTSARLETLDFYDGLDHNLDLDRYRDLCLQHLVGADAYYRNKQAADFPFPGGRTAQRAYLDAVRDFLGHAMGFTVARVPAPGRDMRRAAIETIRVIRERIGPTQSSEDGANGTSNELQSESSLLRRHCLDTFLDILNVTDVFKHCAAQLNCHLIVIPPFRGPEHDLRTPQPLQDRSLA